MSKEISHPDGVVVTYPERDLQSVPTEILRGELARLLTITADHLTYLAAVWRELEHRGEDLSDLRTGLAAYLPLIASRQLEAEAVIRFAGNQALLRAVATLPIEEQKRLSRGGDVPVLTVDEHGGLVPRHTPAHVLTAAQARLVFAVGKVRDLEEQRSVIDTDRMKRASKGISSRKGSPKIRIDRRNGTLKVGRTVLTQAEILTALADLRPVPAIESEPKNILLQVTTEEHRRLKVLAAETDSSITALVRQALSLAGLLGDKDKREEE